MGRCVLLLQLSKYHKRLCGAKNLQITTNAHISARICSIFAYYTQTYIVQSTGLHSIDDSQTLIALSTNSACTPRACLPSLA